MTITQARPIHPSYGPRLEEGYDDTDLRVLEQMVDNGHATLETVPESWAYTHRLTTDLGSVWLVFVREAE